MIERGQLPRIRNAQWCVRIKKHDQDRGQDTNKSGVEFLMEPNRKCVKRTSGFHLGLRNEALKFLDCGINEYIQKR